MDGWASGLSVTPAKGQLGRLRGRRPGRTATDRPGSRHSLPPAWLCRCAGEAVAGRIQQCVECQWIWRVTIPRRQGEHGVAVEHGVHRADGAGHAVVGDARHLGALSLRQGRIRCHDTDGGGKRGPSAVRDGESISGSARSRDLVGVGEPEGGELPRQTEPGGIQLTGEGIDARTGGVDDRARPPSCRRRAPRWPIPPRP